MFVVIFEVQPKPDLTDEYLKLAQHLKPRLEKIDGFLDVERFASGRTEGRLLSLSTWRDEKALVRWRTHAEHHRVQAKGRSQVFEDYRLRVGEVTTDTQPPEGIAIEHTRLDETAIVAAKGRKSIRSRRGRELPSPPVGISHQLRPGHDGGLDGAHRHRVRDGPADAGLVERIERLHVEPGIFVLAAVEHVDAERQIVAGETPRPEHHDVLGTN